MIRHYTKVTCDYCRKIILNIPSQSSVRLNNSLADKGAVIIEYEETFKKTGIKKLQFCSNECADNHWAEYIS